jgi:glycosyltransferase domain-containing protein
MKVAILIPTKNRPDFIERTIAYYDSLKSAHPIYIGDASGPEIAARITAFIKRFNNVEVRYFHWEDVGPNQTTVKLAEEALGEFDYCAFHGDDDYFIPSSLSQCAEFLAKNPNYRTAQGRAAVFSLDRPGPFGEIRGLSDYWGVNALEQETSVERLVSFDKKYFVTQFSTHRTEEFMQDSQHYLEIKDDLIGELLHCFTFAIKGKSKFLDCLYLIRNTHEGIFHPGFWDWIIKKNWSSDYCKTLNALALALQESSDFSLSNAKEVVSKVLKERIKKGAMLKGGAYKINLFAKFKEYFPVLLKKEIREFIINDASDMRLLRSKKSLFYDDFLPVVNSLAKKESS